ncbi:MAG TPA: hypothetical protein VIU61_22225 [Kofleriaceae bacterium]
MSKGLFIAAASLAMTGTAFAQDPADPPAGGEGGGGEAGGEVGGEAGAGAEVAPETAQVEPAAAVAGGVYTKETWPLAAIDRPLTAAKGMIEISPDFDFAYVSSDDGMGGSSSDTVLGISALARYGISDKLELIGAYTGGALLGGLGGLGSGITLSPETEAKGALTVGVGFSAISGAAGGKLDIAPKAAFQYDLLSESGVILAGADIRFKLSDKMWVGTPMNRPGLVATVVPLKIATPVGELELSPISFIIPAAFGFQATPKLMLQLNTTLTSIAINEDAGDTSFIFGDFIVLDVDGVFAISNKMDVRVNLNLGELKDSAGDLIGISAGVNLRL